MTDNEFWLGFWLIVLAGWIALLVFMYLLWRNDFESKIGEKALLEKYGSKKVKEQEKQIKELQARIATLKKVNLNHV